MSGSLIWFLWSKCVCFCANQKFCFFHNSSFWVDVFVQCFTFMIFSWANKSHIVSRNMTTHDVVTTSHMENAADMGWNIWKLQNSKHSCWINHKTKTINLDHSNFKYCTHIATHRPTHKQKSAFSRGRESNFFGDCLKTFESPGHYLRPLTTDFF